MVLTRNMDYRHLKSLIESFLLEENLNTLNRTFGVEFEMCFRLDALKEYIANNKNLFENLMVESEFLRGHDYIWEQVLEHEGFGDWRVHYDGSIKGDSNRQAPTGYDTAIEIVTPILSGENGLLNIMAFLEMATKKLGGYVNKSCGGHVHIGADDLLQGTQKQVANRFIVGLLTAHQFTPLLRALVPEERRFSRWAGKVNVDPTNAEEQLSSADDTQSGADHVYSLVDMFASDRYKMINFKPLIDKGTIEFRIFDGTLDYRTIEERVRFGTAFVNLLAQTEIDLTKNIKSLKDKLNPHLAKGPRTDDVKAMLRNILYRNKEEQKQLINKVSLGVRYAYTRNPLGSVGADLLKAVTSYPLFKKPVNLLEHNIVIEFRTQKNLRDARIILDESGLDQSQIKYEGTKVSIIPVVGISDYRRFMSGILSDAEENEYFKNKGITPEQFLSMMDPKEAEPYKASYEKYKQDLASGEAERPSSFEDS